MKKKFIVIAAVITTLISCNNNDENSIEYLNDAKDLEVEINSNNTAEIHLISGLEYNLSNISLQEITRQLTIKSENPNNKAKIILGDNTLTTSAALNLENIEIVGSNVIVNTNNPILNINNCTLETTSECSTINSRDGIASNVDFNISNSIIKTNNGRGINVFGTPNNYIGGKLVIKNSEVLNSAVENQLSKDTRGVNWYNTDNLEVIINNTKLREFKYVINTPQSNKRINLSIQNHSYAKGWGALNVWSVDVSSSITIEDSELYSYNPHNGKSDNFSTIVLNGDGGDVTMNINNSKISYEQLGTALQTAISLRNDKNYTINFSNVTIEDVTKLSDYAIYSHYPQKVTYTGVENITFNGKFEASKIEPTE